MKKNRVFYNFIFFATLFFFNINSVFAAKDGIGIKIYIKDRKDNLIESAIVLREKVTNYPSAYKVYSSLPAFNTDDAATIFTNYLSEDSNVSGLLSAAGLTTTIDQLKIKKYKVSVDGIYGYQITQYRYRNKTTKTEECNCRYQGTGRCDYYYPCNVGNGSCCHEEKEWVCDTCKTEVWGKWSAWSTTVVKATSKREVQTRKVGDFDDREITTVEFDKTKIEQATKCGLTSVYADTSTAEEAVGSVKYLDKGLGHSKYCPVYCVEENTFTYPGFKPEVASGGHFTWTVGQTNENNIVNGLTVELKGKRDCRTNIDLDGWFKDYTELLEDIKEEIATLEKKPTKEKLCNSSISSGSFASGSAGGYHLIGEMTYITDDYMADQTKEHVAANGHKSNYYLHKYQHYPEGPKTFTGSNGKTYYIMRYQIYEANPDVCYLASSSEVSTGWSSDEYGGSEGALHGMTGATCGGGFDAEYSDNSVSLTNCSTKKVETGKYCTGGYRHCDECLGGTDANGNCIDGMGCRYIQEVCTYTYQYITTGTLLVRRCDYGTSGSQVTRDDMKTDCKETGFYKCPTGYYLYDKNTCYKKNVSKLKDLLKQQQAMIDILAECSSISLDYELKTDMYVDFEEPIYERAEQLIQTKIESSEKENHKVEAGNKIVTFYKCNLDGAKKECWTEDKDISHIWISEYGKEFHVAYEYTLPKEMYQYVLLPNGTSVDIVPNSHKGPNFQNFINIGYSNYPVHYTTMNGLYNLDILYKNVGYDNYFEKFVKLEYPDIVTSDGIITYDCEYQVINGEPFCPPGECPDEEKNGIRLVYRPISLLTPFPGADGGGRTPGNNWNDSQLQLVDKYILNNRNSSGYDVYNKEPMYTVTLTPALIDDIRHYNSEKKYDDFNLECTNGYECKSEFMRETIFTFDSCLSENDKICAVGCGLGDWNDCDKQDGFTR